MNVMILLAESGSTKTEWRLISAQRDELAFRTNGFNPNVQTFEQIEAQLRDEVLYHLPSPPVPPLSGGETTAPSALNAPVSPPAKGGLGGDSFAQSSPPAKGGLGGDSFAQSSPPVKGGLGGDSVAQSSPPAKGGLGGDPFLLQKIIFYGAGFSNPTYNNRMAELLTAITGVADAAVEHDLLAAARAAGGGQRAIVCILGTGSNSCLTDNGQILAERGGHGYLFGDEGGGVDLGRRLTKAALDGELPLDVLDQMELYLGCDVKFFRRKVYEADKPNTLLASLAKFIPTIAQAPEIQAIINASFGDFLDKTVCRYPDYASAPTHFVGSIAGHFRNNLLNCCAERKILFGRIENDPIEQLVAYHRRHDFNH